ncbi:MAG: phosphotransferase, partial [Pseudomonadota bacterium]
LEDNIVPDDGAATLVHGDFRLDNMLFARDAMDIAAVIDWELSTLGHPLADLAYQCAVLRMPAGTGHLCGLAGVARAPLGIPSEAEYVAAYCRRTGRTHIPDWRFYLVFGLFRIAAIVAGVGARARAGNASSASATEVGAMVGPLSEKALEIARADDISAHAS